MRIWVKSGLLTIIALCLICCNIYTCFATDTDYPVLINEIKIDDDLDIIVSEIHTERKGIQQADANENGEFVTFSCCSTVLQDKNKATSNLQKYVDVYDNNGKFRFELRYKSPELPALKLSGNTVYIIFSETALVLDTVTQEVKYYKIDSYQLNSKNRYKNTNNGNKFERGEWTYRLKGFQLDGYRQLVRSTASESQVLVDIPAQFNYKSLIVILFFLLEFMIMIYLIVNKVIRKKNKRKVYGKRYSVDGFYALDEKGRIKLSGFKRHKKR